MDLIVSRISRLPFAPTVMLMFVTVGAVLGTMCPDALVARIAQVMPFAAMVTIGMPPRLAIMLLLMFGLGAVAWLVGSRVGARLSDADEETTATTSEDSATPDATSGADGKRRPINVAELGAPLMSDEALANADALQMAIAARIEVARDEQESKDGEPPAGMVATAVSDPAEIKAESKTEGPAQMSSAAADPDAKSKDPSEPTPVPGFSGIQSVTSSPQPHSAEAASGAMPGAAPVSIASPDAESVDRRIDRNVFTPPTDEVWGYRKEPGARSAAQPPEIPARGWPLSPIWANDATSAAPQSPMARTVPSPEKAAAVDDARLDRLSVLLDRLERNLDRLALIAPAPSAPRAPTFDRALGGGMQRGPSLGQSIPNPRENIDERIDRAFARLGAANN